MTILNGYATEAQFKAMLTAYSLTVNAADDAFIDDCVERASRRIDSECGGRTFYARTETRRFDRIGGRQLDFDEDLLSLTTLTNGDGSVIASTSYDLHPYNDPPYSYLKLKLTSGLVWLVDSSGNSERAISVAGSWGFVDRTLLDDRSMRVIRASETACLALALAMYRKRAAEGMTAVATITAAGVVISPKEFPDEVVEFVRAYGRKY